MSNKGNKKRNGSSKSNENYYDEAGSSNKRKADKCEKSRERDKKKTQQELFLD